MKYLKLIVLVFILLANSSFSENSSVLDIYSDRNLQEITDWVLVDDTIFIKYDFPDTSKIPGFIRIANKNSNSDIKINNVSGKESFVFYKDIIRFNPKKEPYVYLDVSLNYKDSALVNKVIKLVYDPLELLSISREPTKEAKINEKMFVRAHTDYNYEGKNVYLNNVPICELRTENSDKNLYYFFLNEQLEKKDSLSKIFNPKNKSNITVAIGIGTNYEDIEVINSKFKLIFDDNKGSRKHFSVISLILVMIISIYVLFKHKSSILRDRSDLIVNPPFSLSCTQMAFWTMIIIIAFFVVWYNTGNILNITPDVLVLLGISAGTTLGGHLIDKSDIKNTNIKRHQDSNSSNHFLLNILSDSKGLSIHRFQNVIFTVAIGCYFLYEVFKEYKIPDLNTNLMVLMGISSGTYLAIKQGENVEIKKNGDDDTTAE